MRGRAAVEEILRRGPGLLVSRSHPHLESTIRRMVRDGELERIHPGVFSAPRPSGGIRALAACVRLPHAVLYGTTALALHLGREPTLPLHLASPVGRRRQPGLAMHRVAIPAESVRELGPLRLTAIEWACLEAGTLDGGAGMCEALRLGLVTTDGLVSASEQMRGRPGISRARTLAAEAMDNPWSVGELELHRLLRRNGIGGWEGNPRLLIDGELFRPDVLFRRQRVILELDGRAAHAGPDAFENDRRRHNLLVDAGFVLYHFTWTMVTLQSDWVIECVQRALRRSRARNRNR